MCIKKTNFIKKTVVTVFLLAITTSTFAFPVEDLLAEFRLYLMYARQGQSLMNLQSMHRNQIGNTLGVSSLNWDNSYNDLNRLSSVMGQGNSLSYNNNNFGGQFSHLYPGDTGGATNNYSQDQRERIQATQSMMNGVISQMNMSYQEQQQEKRRDDILKNDAKSATGRMQAMQINNEIQAEQIAQLEKLKSTMMAQANADAEYHAYRTQKDAERQKSVDSIVQNADVSYPQYQDNAQFGLIPRFGD